MSVKEINAYTVSELTREIRVLLEDSLSGIRVEGEISNFKVYTSGHAYFSLKDEKSVLNCVMFRSHASRVRFEPRDGLSVLCRGSVSVYDKRGQYQLYVESMEPKGKGALQLAFEQLKEKLLKEGLFDEEKKKEIPALPKHIGVVTSPSGAAIRDILKVVHRRFDNMRVTLYPVKVQGDGAKEEIAAGIKAFNAYNEQIKEQETGEDPVDVLITGRGGGSLEDLWAFNEETVARAIFDSEIPVISAVGHEVDFTIADFAADLRAATPSAAAEVSVPLKSDLLDRVGECRKALDERVREKIEDLEAEVLALRKSYVLRTPVNIFLQLGQQIDDLVSRAYSHTRHLYRMKEGRLSGLAGKLRALSPLSVLERGYGITFKGDKVVKKVSSVKRGDVIKTRLADGEISSTVETIKAKSNG
ncbi:MAG: exodeoxyribonuclease VII large subunit [Candidatus Omnitrophica bacterium]|nr:exodeoxyribonuclease VII large subunit [Candidatus Omnitrophota bacterium]